MTSYKLLIILTLIFYIKCISGDEEEQDASITPTLSTDLMKIQFCKDALKSIGFELEPGAYNLIYALHYQGEDKFKDHAGNKIGVLMSKKFGNLYTDLYNEEKNIEKRIFTPKQYCDNSIPEIKKNITALDEMAEKIRTEILKTITALKNTVDDIIFKYKFDNEFQGTITAWRIIMDEMGIRIISELDKMTEKIRTEILRNVDEMETRIISLISVDPAQCENAIIAVKFEIGDNEESSYFDKNNAYTNLKIAHDILMSTETDETSFKSVIEVYDINSRAKTIFNKKEEEEEPIYIDGDKETIFNKKEEEEEPIYIDGDKELIYIDGDKVFPIIYLLDNLLFFQLSLNQYENYIISNICKKYYQP